MVGSLWDRTFPWKESKWFLTRWNFPKGRGTTTYLGLGFPACSRHPFLPLEGFNLERGRVLRRWGWERREVMSRLGLLGGPRVSRIRIPWPHTWSHTRAQTCTLWEVTTSSEAFLPLLRIREGPRPTLSVLKITGGSRSGGK